MTSLKIKTELSSLVEDTNTVAKKKPVAKKDPQGRVYGTGRRKNSVARVWVKAGSGKVIVNHKNIEQYFARDSHRRLMLQPLEVTKTLENMDIFCTVKGGGLSGQAGAIRHGVARALDQFDNTFHSVLKQAGFLTRDPRVVERKKYGKHGARRSTQFSKR